MRDLVLILKYYSPSGAYARGGSWSIAVVMSVLYVILFSGVSSVDLSACSLLISIIRSLAPWSLQVPARSPTQPALWTRALQTQRALWTLRASTKSQARRRCDGPVYGVSYSRSVCVCMCVCIDMSKTHTLCVAMYTNYVYDWSI